MTLVYFIFGIIFIVYLIPLFDGFSSYILTWIESKKAIQTAKIYQIQQAIENAAVDENQGLKTAIGFAYQEKDEDK